MKFPPALLTAGSIVCVLMSMAILTLAFFNRTLNTEVRIQRQALGEQEGNVEKQKEALQALDKRVDEQEQARDAQEKLGNERQNALYAQQEEIQKQQQEIQKQQEQINVGNQIAQQVGPNLLRDMATASLKNDGIKAVLRKHGYSVEAAPGGTPAAGGKPVK